MEPHRKINSTSIQREVDCTRLTEPYNVADAFAKYFQSVLFMSNPFPCGVL